MIFSFFYNLLLVLMAIALLPKWAYDAFVKKKYLVSWKERLGFNNRLSCRGHGRTVWFHAVSLGETRAMASLVRQFHQACPDWSIIISNGTETGHAEAVRAFPFAEKHVYLPFDFSWVMKKLLNRVRPSLVILSEGDLWYHFLYYAKFWNAKVVIANAKLSERSLKRMKWASFFSKRLLAQIDLIAAQSGVYADRWAALGFPKERIDVTGNLKFDGVDKPLSFTDLQVWKRKLSLQPQNLVITLGSTHGPEEAELLQQMKTVWDKFPHAKVILVPRHPDRFDEVEKVIQKQGISYCRYTKMKQKGEEDVKVILLDTMGLLQTCYQLSDIAVVGGSFVSNVGGHNILEPCSYGVPVLFGPYMHSQPELVTMAEQSQAGKQIEMSKVGVTIKGLLERGALRRKIGLCGKQLMAQHRGATERTWKLLQKMINP